MAHGRDDGQALAIIGMACRLPGADNLDEFWDLIRRGGSAIGEIPPERLDRELHFDPRKGRLNKTYSCLGGIVRHRPFDQAACPLTEQQIASADVAHLALCEVAAAACRHAGLDAFDLPLRNTGVFVGHAAASPLPAQVAYRSSVGEMAGLLEQLEPISSLPTAERQRLIADLITAVRRQPLSATPNGQLELSSLAAAKLISRGFGLSGPFFVVDSACASSLQALAIAAANLQQGRIDMAIVGGASYCKSDTLVLFSQAQSLSAHGSRPFDADADGLILAEGYVALVVKTVARALADGDQIQAVIRGIGMSTDGHGKSLWAPRKEGQVLAIQRAYRHDLDMTRLQYVEAHATSTQIGDATELQALAESLSRGLPPGQKIPIGSVKANVGHTLEAAGLTGLLKTVLAMRHQVVPPVANCERLNPEINWDQVPFFVPTRELPWPSPGQGRPRRAAVNSFGIGGMNVHVVLDEFPEDVPQPSPAPPASGSRTGAGSDDSQAVAIIGTGCLLPGAKTVDAFWELLSSGRDAKSRLPAGRWNAAAGVDERSGKAFSENPPLGGFIHGYAYDWRRHVLPPKQVERANPLQFMLLDGTEQALADAGYDRKPLDRSRVAVIVGTMFGDEFSQQLNMALRLPEFQKTLQELLIERGFQSGEIAALAKRFEKLLLQRMPALIDETGSFTSSTLASRITKSFDFLGGALALDAGEASGLAAFSTAADFLLNGSCDMAVCAAGDRNLGLMIYQAEAHKGRLPLEEPESYFSHLGSGSVPGEGVAVLLLKRLADARRDGDPIRGVLRGFGAAAGKDFYQASRLAMRRALRDGQIEPRDVAAVELAGAPVGEAEAKHLEALVDTYASGERAAPLQVSSLHCQIGNTKAAAGAAAVIKTVLVLEHAEMPAEFGVTHIAPWLSATQGKLTVAQKPTRLAAARADQALISAVTATTDDCLAYHVVLQRGSKLADLAQLPNSHGAPIASTQPASQWPILRIGGNSLADLAERCARLAAGAERAFSSCAATSFWPEARWRLAIVADSPEALGDKLRLASQQLPVPQSRPVLEEQAVFYREATSVAPKIAFLFPGQGSQYPGMLAELTANHPAARDAAREADAALALLGYPTFSEITSDADQSLGSDLLKTQLSVLLADFILFRTLTSMGIQPALVSAHSYGEFAALVAAGSWSLEQAIGATAHRCRAIDQDSSALPTQMLSIAADAETVRRLLAGEKNLYLSHQNAPDQTVVAGEAAAVQAFSLRARSAGLESRLLAVPRAFHTPLMAGAQAPFAAALEQSWILPPRIALMSGVSRKVVENPAEIRANLVAQLTAPVDYVDLVRKMSADGVNVLVEVGPQQVLTRLHRRILGESAVYISADHPKRGFQQQLCRVLAQLECAGVNLAAVPIAKAASPVVESDPLRTNFVTFDATTRRKARLRAAPTQEHPRAAQPAANRFAPGELAAIGNGSPAHHHSVVQTRPDGLANLASRELNQGFDPAAANGGCTAASNGGPAENSSTGELESFLVQFVIDQTGYPPEIVRLDADLEGDLGIDSIKKAQLFAELGEYFDIVPSADLRLDMFPTLRHVLEFLQGAVGKSDWLGPDDGENGSDHRAAESPTLAIAGNGWQPRPPVALGGGDSPAELATVAATTSSLAAPALLSVASGPVLAPVRPRRAQVTVRAKPNAPGINDIERFLVDFVVDQTGYPPEIVKLDADLEGDLGIDSIKKAQMFSELSEFYEVSDPENLRLDDFLTLRHVLELLRSSGLESSGLESDAALHAGTPPAEEQLTGKQPTVSPVAEPEELTDAEATTDGAIDRLRGLTYDAARRFGEKHRSAIRARLKRIAESASTQTVAAARASQFFSQPERFFSQAELAELQGIAEGAGVFRGSLLAHYLTADRTTPAKPGASQPAPLPAATTPVIDKKPARLTTRLTPCMVDAPLADPAGETAFAPVGASIVVGSNPLARAIAARLAACGRPVEVLSTQLTWPQVREKLEQIWSVQPVRHLFLATAHDAEALPGADRSGWQHRLEQGVLTPFFLTQHWLSRLVDARLCDDASLVAVTALGGNFGFSGNVGSVEGGAAAGLVKSLFIESRYEKWTGLRFKAIDFSLDEPSEVAAHTVFQELSGTQEDIEVGYSAGMRRVVRAVQQPASQPISDGLPSGTWVVTGGGRGIVSLTAMGLARRFGLRLHLLGRSPEPDNASRGWLNLLPNELEQLKQSVLRRAGAAGQPPYEQWRKVEKAMEICRTLEACAAAGIAATYHCCDVSNRDDLGRVLEQIRLVDGPIEGVLHGAGVVFDAAFRRKKPEQVRQTYAAKNLSAAALIEMSKQDPLKHFVAFGSMSGRLGMRGQADYSSANDLLAKQIDRLRVDRPTCRGLVIHWHPWGETGLASRPELQATFASLDIKFMPPAEGVEHLVSELEGDAVGSEVLFTDADNCRKQYPLPFILSPEEPGQNVASSARREGPMIDAILTRQAGQELAVESRLDPATDSFLSEHLLAGKPLLPFVVGIESLAEAAQSLLDSAVIKIEQIKAHNGVSFGDGQPLTVRTHVRSLPGGECDACLSREFRDRQGRLVDPERLCLTAQVACGQPAEPQLAAPGQPPLGWFPMAYPDDAPIFHGPKFRCLTQIAIQYDGAFGQIVAPDTSLLAPARLKGCWVVPAAALDGCLMLCSTFAYIQFGKRFEIPMALARLELGRLPQPGEVCIARMYYKGQDARSARYDFGLFGADGACLLSATGYETTVISSAGGGS